jgi:hypothetical protein
MHWKTVGALCAVVTLVTSGCGGSDPPTKASFVKQANAICSRMEARNLALFRDTRGRQTTHDISHEAAERMLLEQGSVNRENALAQLGALDPPDTLQVTFDQWKASLRMVYKQSNRTLSQSAHARYKALVEREQRLKDDLGLTACR